MSHLNYAARYAERWDSACLALRMAGATEAQVLEAEAFATERGKTTVERAVDVLEGIAAGWGSPPSSVPHPMDVLEKLLEQTAEAEGLELDRVELARWRAFLESEEFQDGGPV